MPAATLLSNDEAAALALSFGVALDPQKSVLRIPVTVTSTVPGAGQPAGAAATGFQVDFQPPIDVAVQYTAGEAIAFNVAPKGTYQVKVTRAGRACLPAAHPTLAASDGSVPVDVQAGYWAIGPTMSCN
jgi:hypothetical protein